jgi:ferredoxin-like protein FixX
MAKTATTKTEPRKTAARRTPAAASSALASQIHHLVGCPAERTEEYSAKRPGGDEISVARCVDCGASSVE